MSWLPPWLLKTALGAAGLFAGLVGLVFFLQDKIIYVPRIPGVPAAYPYAPDAFGLEYEDLWLTAADGVRLHAWIAAPAGWPAGRRAQRPVLAFFCENAGNMAYRLHFLAAAARALDCSVFVLSYRGYGASGGRPSEAGLQLDAAAALDALLARPEVAPARLVLMGRSLGGAVAAYAATQYRGRFACLVLENTFTSIAAAAPGQLPFLRAVLGPGRPGNFLLRNKWATDARVSELADVPVLFLSSSADRMLAPAMMRELFAVHGRAPWEWALLRGGGHLDAYHTHAGAYWPALRAFIERATGGGGEAQ